MSTAPKLAFVLEARVQVGAPVDIGDTIRGRRRIVPILGGTFEGPSGSGIVLGGGADWQIVHPDGFSELDSRYTLQTAAGELVYVQNAGVRRASPAIMRRLLDNQPVDPGAVYFRTRATFETSAPGWLHLTRSVVVGDGERYPSEVVMRFWVVE